MENQNKWNKELLYSFIFFIAASALVFLHLFNQFTELISYPSYVHPYIKISIYILFLSCSIYLGIKSWKKARKADNERKISTFLVKSIPGFCALLLILLSLILVIIILNKFILLYPTF